MDILNFGAPAEHPLAKTIDDLIYLKYRRTPRHLQKELGPSEIGEPCERKLALKIMNEPTVNEGDPLPSIVGTAAHTWMEEACHQWNERVGRIEWITELGIEIVPGIIGHSDVYHVPSASVVDWKFPGAEGMKEVRANGPSELYRVQGQLYGKGWARLGLPVENIVIVFLPRGGQLHGRYGRVIESESYDESIADRALERYYAIVTRCADLDVEHHPLRYKLFPVEKGHHCTYCAWFKPGNDTGKSCPGWTG